MCNPMLERRSLCRREQVPVPGGAGRRPLRGGAARGVQGGVSPRPVSRARLAGTSLPTTPWCVAPTTSTAPNPYPILLYRFVSHLIHGYGMYNYCVQSPSQLQDTIRPYSPNSFILYTTRICFILSL